MCLAIPGKIIAIEGSTATIDYGGVYKKASTITMPDAQIGEMVMVHAGFIIAKVDPDEARKTLSVFAELEKAIADEKSKKPDG